MNGFGRSVDRPSRPAAVAGTFYPANAVRLRALVDELIGAAEERPSGPWNELSSESAPLGVLVPHAGLVYSGVVAASAWRVLARAMAGDARPETARAEDVDADTEDVRAGPIVVILGTNHGAAWLDGVGIWDAGPWRMPLCDVETDDLLTHEIASLGEPFIVDRLAHLGEHSIEVQLPILGSLVDRPRIVPLAVSAGTDSGAIAAGERLGRLLGEWRRAGAPVVLAISTDMAHYPPADACARVTAELMPAIVELDPDRLAKRERAVSRARTSGLVCGMCGIQPAVLGLAALRAMGATHGIPTAAATSADAGGPADRTVGYLGVAFVGT